VITGLGSVLKISVTGIRSYAGSEKLSLQLKYNDMLLTLKHAQYIDENKGRHNFLKE